VDDAQALTGGGCRSSHRTVPRVRPAISTFGFGAAGRAGNASESFVFCTVREGVGAGREDGLMALAMVRAGVGATVAQGELVVVALGAERAVEEERGGKGLVDEDEDVETIEPLLPTTEREDCAVDDLSRRTRFPPTPLPFTVPDDMPGIWPPGPGRAG
jgi:hypothetical protein